MITVVLNLLNDGRVWFYLANLETIVELKNILNQIVPPSSAPSPSPSTTTPLVKNEIRADRRRVDSTSEEVYTTLN